VDSHARKTKIRRNSHKAPLRAALLRPGSFNRNRTSVLIRGDQNEAVLGAQLACSGQQVFGPKPNLDNHRSPPRAVDSPHNLSQFGPDVPARGNRCAPNSPSQPASAHDARPQRKRPYPSTATHHRQKACLIRKHHFDNACFRRVRKIRSRHGRPLRLSPLVLRKRISIIDDALIEKRKICKSVGECLGACRTGTARIGDEHGA